MDFGATIEPGMPQSFSVLISSRTCVRSISLPSSGARIGIALVGLARRVVERHIGFGRHRATLAQSAERRCIWPHSRAHRPLCNPDQRQPLSRRLALFDIQKPVQVVPSGPRTGSTLRASATVGSATTALADLGLAVLSSPAHPVPSSILSGPLHASWL
jgi:hypothetical protein